MKSIAKRRFNYIDLTAIVMSVGMLSHGYSKTAILIFIVGVILSVTLEIKYGKKV